MVQTRLLALHPRDVSQQLLLPHLQLLAQEPLKCVPGTAAGVWGQVLGPRWSTITSDLVSSDSCLEKEQNYLTLKAGTCLIVAKILKDLDVLFNIAVRWRLLTFDARIGDCIIVEVGFLKKSNTASGSYINVVPSVGFYRFHHIEMFSDIVWPM